MKITIPEIDGLPIIELEPEDLGIITSVSGPEENMEEWARAIGKPPEFVDGNEVTKDE